MGTDEYAAGRQYGKITELLRISKANKFHSIL